MNDKGEGLFDIYLSDHIDAIIWHLNKTITNKESLSDITSGIVSNLIFIESNWFESSIKETCYFFVNLSKLLVYSEIWQVKGYQFDKTDDLKVKLIEFANDERWVINYFHKERKQNISESLIFNFSLNSKP